MKACGVLFIALLTCYVAARDINPEVPLASYLNSRIKRQNAGGDPNLEGIFGQPGGNINPPQFGNNGQSSSSSNERPQSGFGLSGLDQGTPNNNGGSGFDNSGSNNNQNQGGGFDNFGSNQGTFNNGGFNSQGSNQWPSNNNNGGGFNNQGSSQWPSNNNNGGFGNNNQGSFGSGTNTQNAQRPQTTQRTPLNQIALQTTISDEECLRGCRNRLTQQYNPVCGSDRISYSNRQVFDCYKRECRQDVTVLYAGSCITTRAPDY